MKPHEIYENTNYIANSGLRLLEIPMNSSLTFQKLLWFHATYDIIFWILIAGSNFHRVMVRDSSDILMIVVTALYIIWIPIEIARIRFGYSGNINETFPELIAFLIFTLIFIVPISIIPLFQAHLFPHEKATLWINIAFVFFELLFGAFVMRKFMLTQSAAFYLRTAPLIDHSFAKRFAGSNDIMSTREI